MLNFLKSLFGMTSRANAAADRVALALEGLADDMEAVRARVRDHFGLGEPDASPPALTEDTADHANGNGRGRKRIGA